MSNKINLIYLLGAGRSGTTLLATLLNNHDDIETLGEMHQFIEYVDKDKDCSCGEKLTSCSTWNLSSDLMDSNIKDERLYCENKESHKNIPSLIFNKKADKRYISIQEHIFSALSGNRKSKWYLDSSKYIARYLLLKKSKKLNIKGIYMVRDPRGVINSFTKKVQTSKRPLSAILYYNMINLFGEVVSRNNRNILKIKYEDLVESPEQVLDEIYKHVFGSSKASVKMPEYFTMPHIVGGNRIKTKKRIHLSKDTDWQRNIPRARQIMYYYLCFPFTYINKYRV
ncbi:sulfotransferase [Psychroflexus sp. CAK8W]|uniref:Sulfotransferase n=1 Tax=Psychroflexus longus TaxID=2873596 RepID=A0ABS7XHM4_9FLAO|nr:IdeS/Mac family cysteine endopeptidase [Psychroflexus longus]MBZ9777934.1 sulfotransferase [Psychroflexus longus]